MAPQREWFEKDYYKTLGVSATATAKEITSAYRKLAKKHHPDTNPGHEETFKEISAAYDVLGDADKRKEYDEVRTLGPAAGRFGGGFPGGGLRRRRRTFRVEDAGDLGDLFGGLFGRGRRGGSGHRSPAGRRRRDRAAPLLRGRGPRGDHLGQRDHRRPVPHLLGYRVGARAPIRSPARAAAARAPSRTTRASSPSARSVPQCGGRGTIVTTPCPTCSGTGVEHRNRSVKVRIPAGVEDGQRIRVKGTRRGRPGQRRRAATSTWSSGWTGTACSAAGAAT